MTSVNRVFSSEAGSAGGAPARRPANKAPQTGTPASKQRDPSELGLVARLTAQLQDRQPVRTELVDRIRKEIAAGTYETDERIDATVDRLMDELFPDL